MRPADEFEFSLKLDLSPSPPGLIAAGHPGARGAGRLVGELLSRKRSGVVAALLAACSRLGAAQSAACRALSRGLTGLPAAGVEQRGLAVRRPRTAVHFAAEKGTSSPETASCFGGTGRSNACMTSGVWWARERGEAAVSNHSTCPVARWR